MKLQGLSKAPEARPGPVTRTIMMQARVREAADSDRAGSCRWQPEWNVTSASGCGGLPKLARASPIELFREPGGGLSLMWVGASGRTGGLVYRHARPNLKAQESRKPGSLRH